jgi:predicted transposase YbfD/YdcC
VASANYYCIGLKGNQKKLLEQVQHTAQSQTPLSTYQEKDQTRGRSIERCVRVFAAPSVAQQQWQGFAAFVALERHGIRDGQPFYRQSWFILSQVISAAQAAEMIRNHRSSIENKVHWVKDVVQGEDRSGIRAAKPATLLAFLRSWAMTAFRNSGFDSLTKAMRLFKHNIPKLLSFL